MRDWARQTALLLVGLALAGLPVQAGAARCATGQRAARAERFAPPPPARRGVAPREAVPVAVVGASVYATEHFRVLWGQGYDRADPQWADPEGDGVPLWVETLAAGLEEALAIQRSHGFPDPLGMERYYLDAYVGNTGVSVAGVAVTLSPNFYAYTDVDRAHGAPYFVFGRDFSAHAADELGVLRATAAHELFHAVQLRDYPWDDEVAVPQARWDEEGWWFEATATWMEEVCTPEVDDYVSLVQGFLAAPERGLAVMDGRREYGAAVFPGFLWLAHGEALWRGALAAALGSGLEAALDAQLASRGSSLAQAVASFWALAAHPEDLWPDGALYRSATSPRLFRSADSFPLVVEAAEPARLGAHLLHLSVGSGSVTVTRETLGGAGLLSAASPAGSPWVEVAPLTPAAAFDVAAGGLYLALSQGGVPETAGLFRVRVDAAPSTPAPTVGAAGDGTGPGAGGETEAGPAGEAGPGTEAGAGAETEGSAGAPAAAGGGGSGGGCFYRVLAVP